MKPNSPCLRYTYIKILSVHCSFSAHILLWCYLFETADCQPHAGVFWLDLDWPVTHILSRSSHAPVARGRLYFVTMLICFTSGLLHRAAYSSHNVPLSWRMKPTSLYMRNLMMLLFRTLFKTLHSSPVTLYSSLYTPYVWGFLFYFCYIHI